MEDKVIEFRVILIWAIICVLLIITLMFVKGGVFKELTNKETYNFKEYKVEKTLNRYYTAKAALDKYYTFISTKNKDAVLLILSDKFKKENSLTVENVDKLFDNDHFNLTFSTGKMCSKDVEKGIKSYIVEGVEESYTRDSLPSYLGSKYYDIVLNEMESTFTIEPISESYFKENCHE